MKSAPRNTINPTWTEDELALELFFELDSPSSFSPSNEKVIALSDELNVRRAAPASDHKFRNENGVAMKLHNFSRFRNGGRGLQHGGKREEQVWLTYCNDRPALRARANAIRKNSR